MPRAYFHFQNGSTYLDRDGVDLPDLDSIQAEATSTVAAMLRDGDHHSLLSGQQLRLWVTDDPDGAGQTLFALNLIPE